MSIKRKRRIKYAVLILAPAFLIAIMALTAAMSSSVVAQSEVPAELQSCLDCHNDTTLIVGKRTAWEESLHGTGTAYARGTSASCAGCHSGGGFSDRIAAGLNPSEVTTGDPDPTRQTCRACHQIHTTYTGTDWALETTAPVDLYAIAAGATFDGGNGNLCAQCHQPRREFPAAVGGVISGISSHWGPHHGPQSAMMLGLAGAGSTVGSPSGHYNYIGDTCVACHMGPGANHHFEPNVANCQGCHAGATNFDINGRQTDTQNKLDYIGNYLVNAGVLSSNDADGHPTVSSAPEALATILWNWLYIAHEDGSLGVHNPIYTTALLDDSIALMSCDATAPVLSLGGAAPFWASYADYTAGLLSVTYGISNVGSTDAFNVQWTNSSASAGVTLATALPASVGNIAAGASASATLQYNIPGGVSAFITTNGASAEDNCGTVYTYGAPPMP